MLLTTDPLCLRVDPRLRDDIARLFGAVGGLADRDRDLFERGRGLLEAGGLLFRAPGEIVRRRADLRAARRDRLRGLRDLSQSGGQALRRDVEVRFEHFEGGREGFVDAMFQVVVGQPGQRGADFLDGEDAVRHIAREFDDLHDLVVGIENRIVRGLDPDVLAALADAVKLAADISAAVQLLPEILVFGRIRVSGSTNMRCRLPLISSSR